MCWACVHTHTPLQCSSETNLNATGIHFIIYSLAPNSPVNLIPLTPALPTHPSFFSQIMPLLQSCWNSHDASVGYFLFIDLCQWKESIHLTVKFTPKKSYLIPYDWTQIVFLSRDSPQSQGRVSYSLPWCCRSSQLIPTARCNCLPHVLTVCIFVSSGLCSQDTALILLTTPSLVSVIIPQHVNW